ncbi:MAG: isochorismatase family protein [Gammaproteobacteria bacterium]|nr:isochorismatase family protein [Gammaproteobacteria bacterium]
MLSEHRKSHLLIIDIQEKLAAVMPPEVLAAILRNACILIDAAQALDVPITVTEQYPQGLGPTHAAIRAHLPAAQKIFSKTCFSSCSAVASTPPAENVQGQQFILVGMESHVCVLQSALQLQAQGATVFIVADAVCSRREFHFKNALRRLQQAGNIITSTESVLFEWLRDASHPQFKALSKLIR